MKIQVETHLHHTKEKYDRGVCPCTMIGADKTYRHGKIVCNGRHPAQEAYFGVCDNHLQLYIDFGFAIMAEPAQRTFDLEAL